MNTCETIAAPQQNSRRTVRYPVLIYMILLISYLINIMDRQLFSTVAVEVREVLRLTLPQTGFASTIFTLGVAVAGVPTAMMMSRMPRKYVAILGLVIFSLATWATAYSTGFGDLLLYRFASGVGESMQFIAILAVASSYFYNHKGMAMGALNLTYGLGALVGPNLGASLLRQSSWQTPFVAFGVGGLVIMVVMMVAVSSSFTESRRAVQHSHVKSETAPVTLRQAMSSSSWLLMGASALAGLSIYGYLGLYPTFLRLHLGFTSQQAALASSFYGLGAFVSLLGGWLGDRFHYRNVLVVAFLLLLVPGAVLFTPLDKSIVLHSLFSLVFGAVASGTIYVNLAAGLVKSVHPSRTALGPGLFVASFYLPSAIAGYVMATLRNWLGWGVGGAVLLCGTAVLGVALVSIAMFRAQKQHRPVNVS
jgi:MFS transporter, DHA1 family, inner membrane transport protein